MFIELLRALAVLILIAIVILDDFPFYEKLKKQETQFLIAIIIIVVIYIDTTLGFILALIIMLIYYEIYSKIVKKYTSNVNNKKIDNKVSECDVIKQDKGTCDVVKMDYISNDLLLSAQNNIIDTENYNTEVISPDYLMNNLKVYGAQGVDSNKLNVKGYDIDNLLYSPY